MSDREEIEFIHELMNYLTIANGKLIRVLKKDLSEEAVPDLKKALKALKSSIATVRVRRNTLSD